MTKTTGRIAVTAATLLVAAGCGGSSSSHLDATFLAKVNAVCQQAINDKASHPFPLPNFDPEHAQASQLPAVGAYFAAYGDADLIVTRMDAVGEPSRHAATWDTLRGYVHDASANSIQQQHVAAAQDVAGFKATLVTAKALQRHIDSVGPKLGFSGHSACGRYWG